MANQPKEYWSDDIVVTFDAGRCLHVAECLRGLPEVFDRNRRPWVLPANASADDVAAVVMRCPSGALHFQRKDGGPAEAPSAEAAIRVAHRGPLYVRGDVELIMPDGSVVHETRLALCRCGNSQNKPFCDNSHLRVEFAAGGELAENEVRVVEGLDTGGKLRITPRSNGSYRVEGDFALLSANGQTVYRGNRTALCRCGGSAKKPFCDGTHKTNGFQATGS